MSKTKLEEIFEGIEIQVFAYPDGYTDPEGDIIRQTAQSYKAAFSTTIQTGNELSIDIAYFLPRAEISGGMSYEQFLDILPWKEGTVSMETMEWTLSSSASE